MSGSSIGCRDHPNANLIEDHRAGDMICSLCGLVVGDRVVDVGSEWRTFSDSNNDPSRVGAAESGYLDNDLSTRIGASVGGGTEYHSHSNMSSSNRTLLAALKDIRDLADKANLPPSIVQKAAELFKRVHEASKLRNRPRRAIVAACLYLACRIEQAPRSIKELSSLSSVPFRAIAKCYTAIEKIMKPHERSTHTDSSQFMSRFCSKLELSNEVQQVAANIASVVREKSITDGRNPTSIAAAAIYMASQVSNTKKSQKEISEVAGCAESTIKQTYRLMLPRASELIPSDSPFHSRIDQLPSS